MGNSTTEVNSVIMPTTHIAISGMATMILSEEWHSSDYPDLVPDESGYMGMVSSLDEDEMVPDCLMSLYEQDYLDSFVIRIVGCSGNGIYQGEWMMTTTNYGSTGFSAWEAEC